jgi:hypothetical protein
MVEVRNCHSLRPPSSRNGSLQSSESEWHRANKSDKNATVSRNKLHVKQPSKSDAEKNDVKRSVALILDHLLASLRGRC